MHSAKRRHCLAALAGLAGGPLLMVSPAARATTGLDATALQSELAALEARSGGVLGLAVLDSASGALAGHRRQRHFGLCSSFKLLLAAAVLQRIEAGAWPVGRRIPVRAADLQPHSPVTRQHLGGAGMTALELAEATQTTSDNAAANLLLRELFGGPAGLTQWLRERGDTVTRLDRWEPEMNRVAPGDERDSSTPAAMVATVHRLLLAPSQITSAGPTTGATARVAPAQPPGPASRERLLDWMRATRTGARRLRAGLPADWTAGDKTGTAMHPGLADRYNDVAIVWPGHGRDPWVIAAFYESPVSNSATLRAEDEAVLAEAARLVARWRPA